MSIQIWRSSRLGNGANDDLFPLAGLLNMNELGNMLRPRLRNDHAIILRAGGKELLSSVSYTCREVLLDHLRNLLSLFHLLCQVYVVLAKLTKP